MDGLFRILKGIYDIMTTYLLIVVLYVALMSLGLHASFELFSALLDYDDAAMMWSEWESATGIAQMWWRLGVYGTLQVVMFWLLASPLKMLTSGAESIFDNVQTVYQWLGDKFPYARAMFGFTFSVAITLLLIPFIVQPTLVPLEGSWRSMVERASNLADGQATLAIPDSVIGFYRRLYAEPEVRRNFGVDEKAFEDGIAQFGETSNDPNSFSSVRPPAANGKAPLMDRWDPIIWKVAANDPKRFAQIKAFMWVESGGRQFAVSYTGCAGLMQFCSGTAKAKPFRDVFGRGQVYPCGCRSTSCRVERSVQRDLERGDPALVRKHAGVFPCQVTDARFNADRAIAAGGLYVERLDRAFGGNMYLMYIGYNSGPGVARALYAKLGRNPNATISEIEAELTDVLRRWYKDKAPRRARSLVRIHLPKIQKAFDRYHEGGAVRPSGNPQVQARL